MECLSGIVERITYTNDENGYTVAKIKSKGFSELVTIVGSMMVMYVGATVDLKGQWQVNPKYGKQFCVEYYEEKIPATINGIEKYLGSGLIRGIGPVNAARIVKQFKENTINIIEQKPDRLKEVEGIGEKRIQMIKEAWEEQKEVKNLMLFLQSHDVATTFAVKIFKTYGNKSIDIVKENPYRLAEEIWGIGFRTADRIAGKLGFDKHCYQRCRAGIFYILNELSNDGHCFAYREQLIETTMEILELECEQINNTIESMIIEKTLIQDFEDAIYLPTFFHCEEGVAKRVHEIINHKNWTEAQDIEQIVLGIEKKNNIQYDTIQKQAIIKAVKSKFMVLTGGPGTGKTTTTFGIIKVFQGMGAKIMLAAPTGRAAKRISESTGMEAKTIHRLLELKPGEGYKKSQDNPLNCDVLIVDETSMIDIILMFHLLKAVSNDTVIILVGDIDQLPSVGAGYVLNDMIKSGVVDTVKLTKIFRQARGSDIIMNAHRINSGEFPKLKNGTNSDFFYIEEENPESIVQHIIDLCSKRIPGYYNVHPVNDIQVLCPMQKGDTGVISLNNLLQEVLNKNTLSIKYKATTYKLHDKVMQIKNNYEKNVFNGDIGYISMINLEDKVLTINFDGNKIEYDISELDEIVLAYAVTIHKSQGSEYNIVITPISTQHYIMLQRNLLYTCITRAKKAMVLVGTKKAIAIAVSNNKVVNRNTMLQSRLQRL